MKVDIRDAASVKVLRPLEVASYLRASGWKQVDFNEGQYSVWELNDDFEALLPLRSDLRDFALRMGDLLRILAKAEHRSPLSVLSDLLLTDADVMRVRIDHSDLADGSMPIEDHTRITQKVRDLMMAAACSAIQIRPVWHKRKPDRAVEYLQGVRVGQTERGSYVLTVISRVPPLLRSGQQQFYDEEPYERIVTTRLAQALQAVERAAEKSATSGAFNSFEAAVQQGVSANLCEAVAGISSDGDTERSVEFAFSWSRARPVAPGQVSRIMVDEDRVPFVREAARMLRERAPVEGFDLEGPVVKLEREEGAHTGRITVYALVDNEAKRVRVELAEKEYDQAINAHRYGHTIHCTGKLVREGRGYQLENPIDFSVRPED